MPTCIHFPDDEHSICSLCHPPTRAQSAYVPADEWIHEECAPWSADPRRVEAVYYGSCSICAVRIEPGDFIVPNDPPADRPPLSFG